MRPAQSPSFSPAPADPPAAWLRLAVALAIAIAGSVGLWVVVLVLPAVEVDFGVSRGAASFPYTTATLGFAFGNLVIGRIADRTGIAPVLAGGAVLVGLGFAGSAASPSIAMLAAAQFVAGLGTAAGFGPLMAHVSLWFERRRGLAVGIVACGNYISGMIWSAPLTRLLEAEGWRAVCLTLAVAVPAAVLPLTLAMRRRPPAAVAARATVAAERRTAAAAMAPRLLVALLVVAGFACCMAMAMPQVHIVALCVGLGYGPAVGAEMLALMLAGGTVSRLVFGALSDRLGGVRTVLLGSSLQGLALILYLPSDGLTSLYVVSLVFGLSQGGIVPAYAVIVREYLPAEGAGARVGLVIMATILGMAAGGWMSGWIYDLTGSYRLAFVNGIAWNALNLAIALALFLRSRGPRRPARAPGPAPARAAAGGAGAA
ncbi:MAG: MFS transporter [Rhodobacteraceae bacterium]|nr:MFS transporter [Paracoccaceae bacterium]